MVEITNINVYDLWNSILACRNAMRTKPLTPEQMQSKEERELSFNRAKQLCKAPNNSGHPNFLKGIRVSYDIKYPQYFTPELQRYGFNDIVTSSSKMHRLTMMIEEEDKDTYNPYVDEDMKARVKKYVKIYNQTQEYEDWMRLLSNTPLGLNLFMRCSTNYMQLRTIYHQRKLHRLKEDWGAFCKMIEQLPFFEEFINQ